MKQSHKTLLLWVLLIMIFLGIWTLLSPENRPTSKVSYTEFLAFVEADKGQPHVERLTIKDGDYVFVVKNPQNGTTEKKLAEGPRQVEPEVIDSLRKHGVVVNFEGEKESPFWSGALVTIVPMVLLLGMFYLFMRQLQAGGGKAMSFGKSRARMLNESANNVTFKDVAGIEESKTELEEIIEFLREPK
ncbi:MAG: cell division protein FtsH, partial [Myxococcales bacterium]|nr:cell division protein FtsH [Myxococcales bacterium]